MDFRSPTILHSNPIPPASVSRQALRPSASTVANSQLSSRLSRLSTPPSPASSNSPINKRHRKRPAPLRESLSAENARNRRQEAETAALLASYFDSLIESQELEPPKKASKTAPKAAPKELEMNRAIFAALLRGVSVTGGTAPFLSTLMDKNLR